MNQKEATAISPEEVIGEIVEHLDTIKQFGVKFIGLFGSVARDEARPDSDIDILVEFEGGITLQKYARLSIYLEKILGREIDVVDAEMLRPELRPYVEKDLIPIA